MDFFSNTSQMAKSNITCGAITHAFPHSEVC